MFWLFIGLMCLAAIGFAIWPLLSDFKSHRILTSTAIVFVALGAAGLYYNTGQPGVSSGAGQQPDVNDMVASLAERLKKQPDDLNGWKMLGRSYVTLGNFAGAVDAYQRAVDLEKAQNADTLVNLGVAMARADGETLSPRAVTTIENALALNPDHPEALFYGGMTAFTRGDPNLAARRWEKLLETNPPPEIRSIIESRIAEWRGEPAPPQAAPQQSTGPVVVASVSLSDAAQAALPNDATVFVIARDPVQPSPPIAVTRRRLSELPAQIALGDRESMIPGRNLSAFDEFELLARVSVTGAPTAQTGDWFGSRVLRPAENRQVDLVIREQVQGEPVQ